LDALVTDVQLAPAVAGVRGLGRAGIGVIALGPDRSAAGLWSRYTSDREVGPDAVASPEAYVDLVARVAKERGPLVVYPSREESIDAIVDHLAEMPPEVAFPFPTDDALRKIREKPGLEALAAEVGLRSPATIVEATAGELLESSIPVPSVIKPAAPVGRVFCTARVIESQEELREVLVQRAASDERVLVQEHATGSLISVEIVLDRDGQVAMQFQGLALETWPPKAGSISYAVSVEPDPDLVERAAELLRRAGYWGLAQLDFVDDARGKTLIDVNPRFYACLPLALACGVNLPQMWHAVVTGGPRPPLSNYPIGVTYRWLKGDLAAASQGLPRRLLRRRSRGGAGSAWASDDPLPGVLIASRAVTRRLSGRRARPSLDDDRPAAGG
jgi:predicted ATP-grasp superfamily ATP-dependent carboligase